MQKIIEAIKNGIPVVVVDDYSRENEADVVIAGSKANTENILLAMKHAKGLMCLPCTQDTLDKFKIPMMYSNSNDKFGTPFAVSIDAVKGTSTGMSLNDRLITIKTLLESKEPNDLAMPGHLFPLRAHPLLLKGRRGHTEASVELMKLAGEPLVAVIVEIMNLDGSMAKGDQITEFAKLLNLEIVSVEEIYNAVYNKSL